MKNIAIAAVLGALFGFAMFWIVWLLVSFIELKWIEPYWALLRGVTGTFAFAAACSTACLKLLESDR